MRDALLQSQKLGEAGVPGAERAARAGMHRRMHRTPAAVSLWTQPTQQQLLERGLGIVLWVGFALVLIRVAA